MKRLTHAPNLAIATLWADLLCHAGVPTTVQRAYASSIAGELPPDQALPELWIIDDERLEHARRLLHELRHPPVRHWLCMGCGEAVDGPLRTMLELRRRDARLSRLRIAPRTALLLTLPPLLWAGNAMVGRLMAGAVPPLTLNFLRWSLAFMLLLPLGWRVLRRPAELGARWPALLMLGLLGVGSYNSLQYLALVTTTPINVTLIALQHAAVDDAGRRPVLPRAGGSGAVGRGPGCRWPACCW